MLGAECRQGVVPQRLGKQGVTADIQFAAASLPVGLGVGKHLVFDVEDVPGVVYKDGSGTGGTQPVVLPGEQGSAHHLLHGTQVAGKGGLRQKMPLCRPGKTLLLHDRNQILHHPAVKVHLLHGLQGGAHCLPGQAAGVCQLRG